MKTLRFWGITLMAILLSVNFTSCSDDDEPINIEELEGEWILLHEVYSWDIPGEGTGSEDWNYDFNQPEEGSVKMTITATDEENIYRVSYFFYRESDEDWHYDWGMTVRLEGNKIIDVDYEEDVTEITSLASGRLVLTEKYYEDGTETVVSTWQKKN